MPLTADFWEGENRRLLALFLPRLTQMALTGMQSAARQAGIAFDNTLYNQRAEQWARNYTDDLLAELGTTTERIVGDAVGDWIKQEGATIGELNEALTPAFGAARANAIAVTETTRAFANGQEEAYKAEGITEWTWRTNKDEMVCKYCGGANNKTVKIGEPFGNDAKGNPVTKPPFHPNCILPGNYVSFPGEVIAATKSFYVGRCIEMRFADGRKLTITPNHPILTPRGWVDAQFLRKGDDVISTVSSDGALLVNPNNYNAPTLVEDIFDSFVKNRNMISESVPSSSEDFHGDGRFINGNIKIVYVKSHLGSDVQSFVGQPVCKHCFSGRDIDNKYLLGNSLFSLLAFCESSSTRGTVGGVQLIDSLFGSHVLPFDKFSVASSSERNICLDEMVMKPPSVDPLLITDTFLRFPVDVALFQNFKVGEWLPVKTYAGLMDASLTQESVNRFRVDLPFPRKFQDRFASQVTLNKIVSVREFDFVGHVYDFQVEPYELYVTNGIVTHNCRCWVAPKVSKDKPKAEQAKFQQAVQQANTLAAKAHI